MAPRFFFTDCPSYTFYYRLGFGVYAAVGST
jgi:hypothetical protein